MLTCSRCSAEISGDLSICPACGASSDSGMPTLAEGPPASGSPSASSRPRAAGPLFATGTVLASRFRIVSRLGRGGMGEVYRAEDLKLNQAVALKFLSLAKAPDPADLARFRTEVRLARQVSHPNVCRVFDLIELDGDNFLCMEYIDGENLEALLRRIGRLSLDKAAEIARQLTAGLAAIHDGGLLHRDLKPSNVMIDGRGRARITDFGLALPRDESGARRSAGTPAYMAPEQRARGEVSVQSDLYALGLVLYELFTGRPAQPPGELPGRPERPGNLVDIDPQTEAILLRCLEPDPDDRPRTTLHVTAALTGGDPLAAAAAAGVTLSPEALAAAPLTGSLRPGPACALLLATLASLGGLLALAERAMPLRPASFEHPPPVLTDRARTLLSGLGYRLSLHDWDSGYALEPELNRYLAAKQDPGQTRRELERWLAGGRPPLYEFWYRQEPAAPAPINPLQVQPEDPPRCGAFLALDAQGRLDRLVASPVPGALASRASPVPDWRPLLAAAGLDPRLLRLSPSRLLPPVYSDRRAAWDGTYPGAPPQPSLHIEAASFAGRPVWFRVLGPWSPPEPAPERQNGEMGWGETLNLFYHLIAITTAFWLTLRNLRLGRGDKKGALRLTIFGFATELVHWLFSVHPLNYPAQVFLQHIVGSSLLNWMIFLAFEPYARRLWPERVLSWSRLLAGKLRDPLVGRDLLIGCLFGLGISSSRYLQKLATGRLDESWMWSLLLAPLDGLRGCISQISEDLPTAITFSLEFMIMLLVLRILLRREGLAIFVLWAIATLMLTVANPGPHLGSQLAFSGLQTGLAIFVWTRFGLLAGAVSYLTMILSCHYPLTLDPGSWYAGSTLFVVLVIAALALYGFAITLPRHVWHAKSAVLDG